ncbi:PREDICTED: alpha-amylase 1-like [Priapulus caudatus]|uniref:Alpha-amylase n=1 Tax=Priapulus caudatus TaxID=37621 RepID=A0ABM1EK37_PRICU|nr:PREDICTED: alpha-amylase 1-like [Priapulus caudatus]
MVWSPHRPWWERYQPVSYKLISRSGSEQEFADMVERCNKVGVRIFVDAVINHMTGDSGIGVGIADSTFNTYEQSYPAVPYSIHDFNSKEKCGTQSGNIENYNNVNEVRNCRLVSLLDLDQSKSWVKDRIRDYLNHLIRLGVAGFRVDASKHMWPDELKAIVESLNDLPETHFGAGQRAFVFTEVIDMGGEPITKYEYTGIGRVTEFLYGMKLGEVFRRWNNQKLEYLQFFGESWGMLPSGYAWTFVDNHDNQRKHGGGGDMVLTFWEPRVYKMANAFMLAWPYGYTKVMSSYYWYPREDTDVGPPADSYGNTNTVPINDDGSCGGNWACEHRWRQIRNMVAFRNLVHGTAVENWWGRGDQIAFSRGRKGFLAINNDYSQTMSGEFYTGLPEGFYCDCISGDMLGSGDNAYCTGQTLSVNSMGRTHINIRSDSENPMIAIHVDYKLGSKRGNIPTRRNGGK